MTTTGPSVGIAYQLIAERLNGSDNPDRARVLPSGRTSSEAAFCYQLPMRSFSNNLPDCSNMPRVLGCGADRLDRNRKGSVTIGDVRHADDRDRGQNEPIIPACCRWESRRPTAPRSSEPTARGRVDSGSKIRRR